MAVCTLYFLTFCLQPKGPRCVGHVWQHPSNSDPPKAFIFQPRPFGPPWKCRGAKLLALSPFCCGLPTPFRRMVGRIHGHCGLFLRLAVRPINWAHRSELLCPLLWELTTRSRWRSCWLTERTRTEGLRESPLHLVLLFGTEDGLLHDAPCECGGLFGFHALSSTGRGGSV